MKKGIKSMLRVFLWIVAIIVILIWICFGYHRYKLRKEEKLREPLGQLIDINGNNIMLRGVVPKRLCFCLGAERVLPFWILNPYIHC